MVNRKKFFDIIPPETEEKRDVEKLLFLDKEKAVVNKLPFRFGKGVVIFLVFLVLVFLSCYIFVKPKAEIDVQPKTSALNFETSLEASILAPSTDFSKRIISAVPLEAEKTISQEFLSSVTTTAQKSKGIIRVYNKYYLPVTLIKGTHFLSSDSDVEFLSQRKITIPAKGFIDVGVLASSPGEEYNIGPCAFSIPNLRKFSPPRLYYDITGKSFSKMTGGKIAKVSKVTEEDLDRAKKVLSEKALKEGESIIKDKVPEGTVILRDTIEPEIIDVYPLVRVGQEVKNFTVQTKVKIRALGIERKDLEEFAKKYILSKISSDKEFSSNTLDVNCKTRDINMEQGKANIILSISAGVYSRINEESLKSEARGKFPQKAREDILSSFPNLSDVKIMVKPIWRRRVTRELRDIKIKNLAAP